MRNKILKTLYLLSCILVLWHSYVRAITGPSILCVGSIITLSDTATGGIWSSSDTTIATIDNLGNVSGISTGTATISYTTGSGTSFATVTVDAFPSAGTITGPDSICAWSQALLTCTVPGGMWAISNTKASIDSTGLFVGMFSGLDTVYYIVSNTCGTDTAEKVINILPLAEAGYIVSLDRVCIGDTITVTNAIQGGTWYHTNATTLFIDSIVVGLSTGIDTIVYRVVNSCGTDSAIRYVTVTAYPDAGKITGTSTLCVGQTIRLTDTSKGGVWRSTAHNTTIYDSLLVTGKSPGVDTITYRITNVCATDIALWPVTINPLPAIPAITRSGNELSVPFGYTSYQWLRNGDVIPDATTRYWIVDSLANYYAVVSNDFGCSAQSFPQTVTDLYCDIDDLHLYPNPAESIIYINWCRKVDVTLLSMDGKEIKATHLNQLDISHLPNGTYHISIFDEQGNRLRTSRITKLTQ